MTKFFNLTILFFVSYSFTASSVNLQKEGTAYIADLINNSSQSVFNFENQTIDVDRTIEIKRSNITIKNLRINVRTKQKLYDLIIQVGHDNNRYYNIQVNGNYLCNNGISAYDSKNTYIENCNIENIGYNDKNVVSSAIRLIGDCSDSKIKNCNINNIQSYKNSTGITISQTLPPKDNVKKYSKRIEVVGCVISNITSYTNIDADGIKVLEETGCNKYNRGFHIFRNITFENCDKRGLKLQTSNAKCYNITCKNGNFSQSAIDFFGENPVVNTLKIQNLDMNKHTYGIYLHTFKKAIIRNVIVKSIAIGNSHKTLIYSENNNNEGELYIDNVNCSGYNMLYRCKPKSTLKSINISDTNIDVQYHYSLIVNSDLLILNNFKENKWGFTGWYRTFQVDNNALQVVKSNTVVYIDKAIFEKIACNKETDISCYMPEYDKTKVSVKNGQVKILQK